MVSLESKIDDNTRYTLGKYLDYGSPSVKYKSFKNLQNKGIGDVTSAATYYTVYD